MSGVCWSGLARPKRVSKFADDIDAENTSDTSLTGFQIVSINMIYIDFFRNIQYFNSRGTLMLVGMTPVFANSSGIRTSTSILCGFCGKLVISSYVANAATASLCVLLMPYIRIRERWRCANLHRIKNIYVDSCSAQAHVDWTQSRVEPTGSFNDQNRSTEQAFILYSHFDRCEPLIKMIEDWSVSACSRTFSCYPLKYRWEMASSAIREQSDK